MAVRRSETNMTRENVTKKSPKTTQKTLLLAHELKLARSLAGNTKLERDRALKSLKTWFKQRAAKTPFSEEDFQRLWKGLYYSMWMSDKPLIQEECAENISGLIHCVPTESQHLFFKAGLTILANEWFGIDQLRLNKFLMFTRRFLRQALVCLKEQQWALDPIQQFNRVLNETIFGESSDPRHGFVLHFIDVFLEELAKVADGTLPPGKTSEFLTPFARLLAHSDDVRIVKRIRKHIYEQLMEQSDVGLEYRDKYAAWKQLGFPGTINQIVKIDPEDFDEPQETDEAETEENEQALDPRAGRVDVTIPQLQFKPKLIVAHLKQYKTDPKTNTTTRKTIAELMKQFQTLSQGVFPLGVNRVQKPQPQDFYDVRKAAKDLIKFDNKIQGKSAAKRKNSSDTTKLRSGKKLKLETGWGEQVNQELKDICEKSPRMQVLKQSKTILKQNREFWDGLKRQQRGGDNPKIKIQNIEKPPMELAGIFKRNSGTWFVFKMSDEVPKETGLATQNSGDWETHQFAIAPVQESPRRITPIKIEESPKSTSKPPTSPKRKSITNGQQITPRQTPPRKVKMDKSTPQKSPKRVKINTKLNCSQEYEEHFDQLINSPAIPFDANKKPSKPLLKTPVIPSPINPFYFRK